MTGPGYGTPWLRIDHELVGRVLAEKARRRFEQRGEGDAFHVARIANRLSRRVRAAGGVG